MKSFNRFLEEKGLWDNIHAKRKRGEKMRKPGEKGAPTAQDFKDAQKTSEAVEEKKLTPAELKKREEIAKAMERENPNMPMAKKMAIATATAKKVAEETLDEDISKMSHGRLKWHMNSGVPHGSYTKDEMKKERDRRLKTGEGEAYKNAKAVLEKAEQVDEISRDLARRYIRKVADKTNTGELSTKEVEKRRPGVHLAGKKAYPGIAGKAKVSATEAVEPIDEISKKTLGSYIKKAKDDLGNREAEVTRNRYVDPRGVTDPVKHNNTLLMKRANRRDNINKAVDKLTKEEVELDEAVEVSHDRYMRSHGKKASGGEGNWMFTHKRMGDANVNDSKEVHSARGKFSDAKKSAQQWAKKHGHSTVYVMEEVEQIDEISQDKLYNYHAKAGADLQAKRKKLDQGKLTLQDLKKGQNRVTGLNRAANKMHEEVELDEVSTEKLRDYASAALQDKNKAKADKRWKYASKALNTVADREVKAAHARKYNKMESVELDENIAGLFKDASEWEKSAKARGLVVKPATHPSGETTKYHIAKDKQGNNRGHFDHGTKTGRLKEEVELDEVSSSTLSSYISKADANRNEKDRSKGINLAFKKKHPSLAAYNKNSAKVNARESVVSADKKPEKFMKPDGTVGIRLTRTDKNVIKKDA